MDSFPGERAERERDREGRYTYTYALPISLSLSSIPTEVGIEKHTSSPSLSQVQINKACK